MAVQLGGRSVQDQFDEFLRMDSEPSLETITAITTIISRDVIGVFRRYGIFDPDTQDDLLSEVTVRFIGSVRRDGYKQEKAAFRTYIWTIAVNVARTYFKRLKRSQDVFQEGRRDAAERDDEKSDPQEGPPPFRGHVLYPAESSVMVHQALEELSDEEHKIISLIWEGLTADEIANQLGISVEEAASKIRKAKERLRSLLKPTRRSRQGPSGD